MLQAQGIITSTQWGITSGRDVKPIVPNGPGSSSSQGKKRARDIGGMWKFRLHHLNYASSLLLSLLHEESVVKREIQDVHGGNPLNRSEHAIALMVRTRTADYLPGRFNKIIYRLKSR